MMWRREVHLVKMASAFGLGLTVCAYGALATVAGMDECGAAQDAGSAARRPRCSHVEANGFKFQCRFVGPGKDDVDGSRDPSIDVLLLHGFPEWSHHWIPVMEHWSGAAFAGNQALARIRAVACDLRGYSPLAAPDAPEDYEYDVLSTDVWALADALGFRKFHLIGHDHGAALAWFVAASGAPGAEPGSDTADATSRLLSLTTLSVPHPKVFSDAIYGPTKVEAQVVASNYFNQFSQVDSATANGNALGNAMKSGAGFATAADFQKALWWYWGSIGKWMARPPVVHVTQRQNQMLWFMQQQYPLPEDAGQGATRAWPSGYNISAPVLFVCGTDDAYLLCAHDYVLGQRNFVDAGVKYEAVDVDCGHDLMKCKHSDVVFDAITAHILESSGRDLDSGAEREESAGCTLAISGGVVSSLLLGALAFVVGPFGRA